MNKNLLKSEMALHGDTGGTLAAFLGISQSTFSLKLNETNGAEFNKEEMERIRERYNLDGNRFCAIFFPNLVS